MMIFSLANRHRIISPGVLPRFFHIFFVYVPLNELCIPGRKKNIAAKATKPAKVVESISQWMGKRWYKGLAGRPPKMSQDKP